MTMIFQNMKIILIMKMTIMMMITMKMIMMNTTTIMMMKMMKIMMMTKKTMMIRGVVEEEEAVQEAETATSRETAREDLLPVEAVLVEETPVVVPEDVQILVPAPDQEAEAGHHREMVLQEEVSLP